MDNGRTASDFGGGGFGYIWLFLDLVEEIRVETFGFR